MIRIAAAQARQQWGESIDRAQVEPVMITTHGRDRVLLVSAALAPSVLEAIKDAEDARLYVEGMAEYRRDPTVIEHHVLMAELGLE